MSGLGDRRRNLGPVDAVPFQVPFTKTQPALRDGLRPVYISQGVAAHATGSAYVESGETRIQSSVYGPQQARGTGEFKSQAQVTVNVDIESFAGSRSGDSNVERTIADFVRTSVIPVMILKNYPKSDIIIRLSVLSAPHEALASLLAVAVNSTVLALVNSGISLRDMVTAVGAAICDDGRVVADVDAELHRKQAVCSYSLSQGAGKLVGFLATSDVDIPKNELESLFKKAEEAAVDLRRLFNGYLVENYAETTAAAQK